MNHNFGGARAISRRSMLLGAGGVAMAGLLLGCSSGGTTTGTSAAAASGSAASTPKRGGTFRVGAEDASAKDNLDPALAFSAFASMMARAMFDSLVKEDSTGKQYNSLAQTFEADATARVWTIRIHDGVTFHDGRPLTIDDVIFSIKRAHDTKESLAVENLKTLDPAGMKKVDKLTVELTLTSPNSFFKQGFSHPSLSIVPANFNPKAPVGSGPFKYVSFASQKFVAERNPSYWGEGKPYLDRIEVIGFADPVTARMNALLSGQIDAMANLSFTQAKTLTGRPDLQLLSAGSSACEPITMRVDQAPFNDRRVLEAFKLMVDRQQLVTNVYDGRGRIANDLAWAQDPYYASGIPQRAYDPDKAKSLLKAAGHDGMTIEFSPSPELPWNSSAAQVLVEQAKKVGVTITLAPSPDLTSFYDKKYLKSPFSQDAFGPNPLSVTVGYSLLPGSPYNESHWSDPKAAALFSSAASTNDEAKKKQYLTDFQQLIHDDAGWIVWGFRDSLQAVSNKFGGIKASIRGINMFDLSGIWQV